MCTFQIIGFSLNFYSPDMKARGSVLLSLRADMKVVNWATKTPTADQMDTGLGQKKLMVVLSVPLMVLLIS